MSALEQTDTVKEFCDERIEQIMQMKRSGYVHAQIATRLQVEPSEIVNAVRRYRKKNPLPKIQGQRFEKPPIPKTTENTPFAIVCEYASAAGIGYCRDGRCFLGPKQVPLVDFARTVAARMQAQKDPLITYLPGEWLPR